MSEFLTQALLIVFSVAFLVITIIANSLVLYVICRHKHMKKPSNYGILSIASCDLFFVMYSIIRITCAAYFYIDEKNISDLICITLNSIGSISYGLSLLTPVAVAIDRFIAVCHPMSYYKWNKSGLTAWILTSCWIIAPIMGIGVFIVYVTMNTGGHDFFCLPKVMQPRDVYGSCLMQLLCIIIIVTLYLMIFKEIRVQVSKVGEV